MSFLDYFFLYFFQPKTLAGDLAASQLSMNTFALFITAARLLISRPHNSKVTLLKYLRPRMWPNFIMALA
jgi:hypothetical protein